MLSASANKLSKLTEQAEEYASLIMEELDPENYGYIEVYNLASRTHQTIFQFIHAVTDTIDFSYGN